jgi:hypothetical protein
MVMYCRMAENKQATAAREKCTDVMAYGELQALVGVHVTFCRIVYLIKVKSHFRVHKRYKRAQFIMKSQTINCAFM